MCTRLAKSERELGEAGRRSEGQVDERGRANVVIWGRCMSRMRRIEPGLGVFAGLSSTQIDEDDGWGRTPSGLLSRLDGGVNRWTLLSCFSLTESKQIGQRAHLEFSD